MRTVRSSLLLMLCLTLWFAVLSTAGVKPVKAQDFIAVPIFKPPSPYSFSMAIKNLSGQTAQVTVQVIENGVVSNEIPLEIQAGDTVTLFSSGIDLAGLRAVARVFASVPLDDLEIRTYSIGYDREKFISVGDGGNVFGLSPYTPITEVPASQAVVAAAPYSLTVNVGDTVTWIRVAGIHSVTADDGSFDSGDSSDTWDVFSHTFDEAGLFPYYCKAHGGPGGVGMSGIINVVGGDEQPTQSKVFLPALLKPL